eukprot:6185862-Pleurochrysis_carterae.AAC.2
MSRVKTVHGASPLGQNQRRWRWPPWIPRVCLWSRSDFFELSTIFLVPCCVVFMGLDVFGERVVAPAFIEVARDTTLSDAA